MVTLKSNQYKLGNFLPQWKAEDAQTITFIVTEDCNLRCKYCYITHKSSNKKMNFEIAKKFIDLILSSEIKKSPAVILDFIGGEPLLELELIDKICNYFKITAYERNCQWWWNYRINIGTNGVLFNLPQVKEFFKKNQYHLSVGITIDGTKEKHDLMRVYPDGTGSYNNIIESIPEYLEHFSPSTKVTFSSDDLPLLKDSIIHLWKLGITDIAANVVFENVWKENDDKILEDQLIKLADYAIEHDLYNKVYCTFFDERLGFFLSEGEKNTTCCGAGKMIALGPDGKIYPCMRYKDYSLNKQKELDIGSVFSGINMEKVRTFMVTSKKYQSDRECLECPIATGCEYCQGFSYDESKTSTNFERAKYICKMHKARAKANDYYFSRLFNEKGIARQELGKRKKLYFLLSNDYITYCSGKNSLVSTSKMSDSIIINGLKYARDNFMDIVFVHPKNEYLKINLPNLNEYTINHIVSGNCLNDLEALNNVFFVFDENNYNPIFNLKTCLLNVNAENISKLSDVCIKLFNKVENINLNVIDLNDSFDFHLYYNELCTIADYIVRSLRLTGKFLKINVLTDIFEKEDHGQCEAGTNTFVLAPTGKIYTCPKMYEEEFDVGDVNNGIKKIENEHLLRTEFNPLCSYCKSYQCINCRYINLKSTNEVNVSPSFQCKKSNIERLVSVLMQSKMPYEYKEKKIDTNFVYDPINLLLQENNITFGFYDN